MRCSRPAALQRFAHQEFPAVQPAPDVHWYSRALFARQNPVSLRFDTLTTTAETNVVLEGISGNHRSTPDIPRLRGERLMIPWQPASRSGALVAVVAGVVAGTRARTTCPRGSLRANTHVGRPE